MLEIENELSSEERQLVDAIQERINDTNAIQLIKYREIGKLIDDAYGDQKDYGSSKMDKIAKLVGKSPKTLYGYWKFYKDFDKNRIEILARQKFPIRYTLLRVYGSIGADKFMEIYEEATSLNDFKAKVRAQWEAIKSQKENEASKSTEDIPDGNANPEGNCDENGTEKDGEKSSSVENSAASDKGQSPDPGEQPNETPPQDDDEKEDGNENHEPEPGDDQDTGTAPTQSESPDPIKQTNGTPSQDEEGNQDHGETEPGDTQGAETVPALDKPKPDDGMTGDGNSDPTDGIYDFIKQEAGSAVEINQPESEKGKTPIKSLSDGHEEPDQSYLNGSVNAQSELKRLQKENEDLKLENIRLRKENDNLKQRIEDLSGFLETRTEEKEPEYA